MKVTIEGNELVIRVKIEDNLRLSSTGKTFLVASASGKTGVDYEGKPLSLSMNAFIPAKDGK